jgi:hypothetical protein
MLVSFWQGFKRFCCSRQAVVALLAITTPVHAASIVVLPLGADQPSLVVVNGTMNLEDKDEFLRQIASLSRAIVSFESDGGSLLAGLQIGETIRLKNFSTLVADNARCASSCALAWLGGTKRFMGAHAQVGFHAAYDGNTHQVTSSGNALVGAYLNKIGLPSSAVIYITSASPDSVTWLSKTDAEKLGIEVSLYSFPSGTRSTTSAPADTPQGGRIYGGYLARPIREGTVFLVRMTRPQASSDEAHRIALGFSPPVTIGTLQRA